MNRHDRRASKEGRSLVNPLWVKDVVPQLAFENNRWVEGVASKIIFYIKGMEPMIVKGDAEDIKRNFEIGKAKWIARMSDEEKANYFAKIAADEDTN